MKCFVCTGAYRSIWFQGFTLQGLSGLVLQGLTIRGRGCASLDAGHAKLCGGVRSDGPPSLFTETRRHPNDKCFRLTFSGTTLGAFLGFGGELSCRLERIMRWFRGWGMRCQGEPR